jgi:hypothetical protein
MSITVQYGPIAQALGLAQVAGAGQGYNVQAQRDLQALQIQDAMQRTANQKAATDIQQALAYDELRAKAQQQQSQDAQTQAYRNAQIQIDQERNTLNSRQLDQSGAQAQAEQRTREQQSKYINEVRQQEIAQKTKRDAWMQTLTPEEQNIVMSGGHLPNSIEADAEKRRLTKENLDTQMTYGEHLTKQRDALLKMANDPLSNMGEADRSAAQEKIKQLNLTIDGINAATGQKLGIGGGTPQAPAASSAPQIPPDVWAEAESAVGRDPKAQAQWVSANWKNIVTKRQQALRPQQQNQVQSNYQKLSDQDTINRQQVDDENLRNQVWGSWASNPPIQG